jgi:SH3-like domain-containing protein
MALVFILLTSYSFNSYSSIRKFPYFASIKSKSDIANVRSGPSIKYPIEWVYQKPGWPVEVVSSYENWRKIRDALGDVGWIHETLLSGKRNAIIMGDGTEQAYKLPVETSPVVMLIEENVVVELISCKSNWCKIEAQDKEGWISGSKLWGVNFNEELD